jgi:hypothetical protein
MTVGAPRGKNIQKQPKLHETKSDSTNKKSQQMMRPQMKTLAWVCVGYVQLLSSGLRHFNGWKNHHRTTVSIQVHSWDCRSHGNDSPVGAMKEIIPRYPKYAHSHGHGPATATHEKKQSSKYAPLPSNQKFLGNQIIWACLMG